MSNKLTLFWFVCLAAFTIQAQQPILLQLEGVLQRAEEQSPNYFAAKNRAENSYWAYRSFRAGLLPQVRLNTALPLYNNNIDRIIQPDGTALFRARENAFTSAELSVNQAVALTGGTFNLRSALQRNRNLQPVTGTDFFSTPFILSYNQPLILYNELKWNQKTRPMLYEESRRRYVEDVERIHIEAVNFFFAALDAQIQVEVAKLNKANQDTLYELSVGRYNLGKIAENDLLQIELSKLNADAFLNDALFGLENSLQSLKRFLGYPMHAELILEVPANVPKINPDLTVALLEAAENRQAIMEFRRVRIEADQEIARARGTSGIVFQVSGGFGVSDQGSSFQEVYEGPKQQQQFVNVSLGVPIMDWGLMKARVRQARANRELVEVTVMQDEMAFEQEIQLQVMRFKQQARQLEIAAKADTVAQKRFEVTKQRYFIGKIDITNLNLAQQEKDQARRAYIQSLRNYWNSYFTLRRLTLYDFEKQEKLNFKYADLLDSF
jgi:outer membrane protein TolC